MPRCANTDCNSWFYTYGYVTGYGPNENVCRSCAPSCAANKCCQPVTGSNPHCLKHEAKIHILSGNLETFQVWYDGLSDTRRTRLRRSALPELLRQKTMHKKLGKEKVSALLKIVLKKKTTNWRDRLDGATAVTYLKYSQNAEIDKFRSLIYNKTLRPYHLLPCLKAGCGLNETIDACFSTKIANQVKEVVDYYRKFDLMVHTNLYCLPAVLVAEIMDFLD